MLTTNGFSADREDKGLHTLNPRTWLLLLTILTLALHPARAQDTDDSCTDLHIEINQDDSVHQIMIVLKAKPKVPDRAAPTR